MNRNTVLSRFAALAVLVVPAFALADSSQPCPCTQPCGSASESMKADSKEATPSPQSTTAEEQQRIWTSP